MRIVGGRARGRRLAAPPDGTRPTSDRGREALFNSLAAHPDLAVDLDGARVLDLFAGTGAVGLEALSRGASEAVFVEKGRAALAVLRRNIDTVGLPGPHVISRPVAAVLDSPPACAFDLIFADPPYAISDDAVNRLLQALGEHGWSARGGVVVLERPARSTAVLDGGSFITPVREKAYGDSLLWYGLAR